MKRAVAILMAAAVVLSATAYAFEPRARPIPPFRLLQDVVEKQSKY